ncbi:MAG: hypothetical protein CME69_07680 [Halobacteriovorax sp.]|nr:hypothetical protein [Halobacteriovorax sp.]
MVKLLIITLYSLLSLSSFALDVPNLKGRVNDYAGLLSPAVESELESILEDHEKKTTNQIAILTIYNLQDEILENYSLRVAREWGLGQKNKNNGVLLLISKFDRKLRIEVGYGVEGALTDIRANKIIRHYIVPQFKKGNFEKGIKDGIEQIINAIDGEQFDESMTNQTEANSGLIELIFIFIFGSVFFYVGIYHMSNGLIPFSTILFYLILNIQNVKKESKNGFGWHNIIVIPLSLFMLLLPGLFSGVGIFNAFMIGSKESLYGIISFWAITSLFIFKKKFPSKEKIEKEAIRLYEGAGLSTVGFVAGGRRGSRGGSFSSGSSGGFSGGGGSFGGGGSSGSW